LGLRHDAVRPASSLTLLPMGWSAQVSRRGALLIVGVWLAVAGAANLAVPQLETVVHEHARSFMPSDAPSSVAAVRSAELFGEATDNNLNYVVLERENHELTDGDRAYYDRLIDELSADTEHVRSVTDLWADPLTEAFAVSGDGRAATVMLRLAGVLGTTPAAEAVQAVRAAVSAAVPPAGLAVFVTGPGATIVDEFSAIDRQMLMITAATIGLILLLLLVVYRSPVAAMIPLFSVGVALALARPVVAALGEAGVIEVSLFSVALVAAMMLGAGTDYAIFLIGRYQEGLRNGMGSAQALIAAQRGVAPVVAGSALTVATALACLGFADVGMFRSAGIPSAIGILVVMAASLSLTPALIGLAGGAGLLRPTPNRTGRRWRRLGASVSRWPAPILVTALGVLALLALPAAGIHSGWNEPDASPADTGSNQGYAAAGRHFEENHLLPDVVAVRADRDLRTPAGLIAVERITREVMEIPGVRLVQSPSRPAGVVPEEATLTGQIGRIGDELAGGVDSLKDQLSGLDQLDTLLDSMATALSGMRSGLQGSAVGLGEVSSAAADMQRGTSNLQSTASAAAGRLDPLRGFVTATPNCPANPVCAVVQQIVTPVDEVVAGSAALTAGVHKLTSGSSTATDALGGVPASIDAMSAAVTQARRVMAETTSQLGSVGPQLSEFTDYLRGAATAFEGSAAGGFYLPHRALADPRLAAALDRLISPDGRAVYLLVYGRGHEWGVDGATRTALIESAVAEATKEGVLRPLDVHLAGVGPATRDLQAMVAGDTRLLVMTTLALIFAIVALLLRSPVAGLVVVGTVALSYAAALGASVLIWQHLLGLELHWAVAPIAFIALIAVGADYNLLLAMRIREEVRACTGSRSLRTGIIRAFGATGGVVTTAGLVFGLTMLALLGSSVLSIAQIGLTVGIGLLIDTMLVRTFLLPTLMVLLGRWFWWPSRPQRRSGPSIRGDEQIVGGFIPMVQIDRVGERTAS
jgi:putative drug exporter of the RND superfamily